MKNEYTITIENKTRTPKKKAENAIAGNNKGKKEEPPLTVSEAMAEAMVAYRQIKPFITSAISHEVSLVELRTGSKELQEKANFINHAIQQGTSMLENIALGALVGGGAGAALAASMSVIQSIVGFAKNQQTLNIQQSVENRSLDMQIVRAGAGRSRSSNE